MFYGIDQLTRGYHTSCRQMSKSKQRPEKPGKGSLAWIGVFASVTVAGLLVFLLIPKSDPDTPSPNGQGSTLPGEPSTEAMRTEAVEVARDLVENLPGNANALALAAMMYDGLGESDESMACWQKCLILAPNRADAAHELGRIALKRDEYDKAVSVLRRAVEFGPRTTGIHHSLAYALMSLGRHAEAISHFEKEIEIAPTAFMSHYLLAQTRRQLGQHEAAKRSYEAALRIQPDNKNAIYGLASVLTKLGDKTRAAEYWQKYADQSRAAMKSLIKESQSFDDHAAMRGLLVSAHTEAGKVCATLRRGDDAEGHWRRAFAIDTSDIPSRMALGYYLLHGRRNVSEARRLAIAVVALDPSAAGYALLARSHHANGDIALARKAVKRAIAKDPANPSYRQILWMIEGGI